MNDEGTSPNRTYLNTLNAVDIHCHDHRDTSVKFPIREVITKAMRSPDKKVTIISSYNDVRYE